MTFCSSCGNAVVKGGRFCHSCGAGIPPGSVPYPDYNSAAQDQMSLPSPPSTDPRQLVLVAPPNPIEEVLFESTYPVQIDGQKWRVYVTNRRMVFHRSIGLLSSRESRQDVDLDTVKNLKLQREKTLLKEYYLDVDGVVIKGRRSDLVNLQRAVQKVKPSVGGL